MLIALGRGLTSDVCSKEDVWRLRKEIEVNVVDDVRPLSDNLLATSTKHGRNLSVQVLYYVHLFQTPLIKNSLCGFEVLSREDFRPVIVPSSHAVAIFLKAKICRVLYSLKRQNCNYGYCAYTNGL